MYQMTRCQPNSFKDFVLPSEKPSFKDRVVCPEENDLGRRPDVTNEGLGLGHVNWETVYYKTLPRKA
jgi:hypothetical protein